MTDQHNYSDNTASETSGDDPLEELARIVSGDYKPAGANHWPRTTPTLPREARQAAAHAARDTRPAPQAHPQPQTDDFDLESELERELGGNESPANAELPVEQVAAGLHEEIEQVEEAQAADPAPASDSLEDALLAELDNDGSEAAPAPVQHAEPDPEPAKEAADQQGKRKSLVDKLFPFTDLSGSKDDQQPAQTDGDELYAEMDSAFADAVGSELGSGNSEFAVEEAYAEEPMQAAPPQDHDHAPAEPSDTQPRAAASPGNLDMDFSAAFEEQVRQMESTAPQQDAGVFDEVIGAPRHAAKQTQVAEQTQITSAAASRAPSPDFSSIWQQAESEYQAPEPQQLPEPDDADDQFASAFADELANSDAEPAHESAAQMLPEDGGWQAGDTGRSHDDFAYAASHGPEMQDHYADADAGYAQHEPGYGDPVPANAYTEQDYADQGYADQDYDPRDTARQEVVQPRKVFASGFRLAAMALGVALLIGGAAIAYTFMSGDEGSTGPVVIKADPGPVKVKPEDPGGAKVANQDQPSYERVSGESDGQESSQERLVTTTEEPVDVSALTRNPGQPGSKTDARLQPGEEEVSGEDSGGQLAPRRVRTVAVKPDGTVVAGSLQANQLPASSNPGQAAIEAKIAGASGLASDKASSQVPAAPQLQSIGDAKSTGEIAVPTPRPAPGQRSSEAATTDPTTDPVVTAVADSQLPAREASTTITADSDPATSTATSTSGNPQTGSAPPARSEWMVQLSSQTSAEDAQQTYQTVKSKYASLLDGRQLSVLRADLGDKGVYYRVRAMTQSKSDAEQLCGSIKSEGGDCFVTNK